MENFKNKQIQKYAVILLVFIGVFFRFFRFGDNPKGLSQDEASIGYETYSLLKTHGDRWGNHLPVYFVSWGSGQNTLYAYLDMLPVSLLGPTHFSIRLPAGILGLLTVLLVYFLVKSIYKDKRLAWLCTLIYLFNPWHFMVSRWAFEENIVPFFMILSLLSISKGFEAAEEKQRGLKQKLIIFGTFLPLSFLFYSYALSLFIVPPFLLLLLFVLRKDFMKCAKGFSFSLLGFLLLSTPFFLFVLKNNILHQNLPFERYLPFTIQEMLSARESIIKPLLGELDQLFNNMVFMASGLNDMKDYNLTNMQTPHLFLLFAFMAIVFLVHDNYKKADKTSIILIWTICSLISPLLFWANINRTIHLHSIIPILTGIGLYVFFTKFSFPYSKLLGIAFVLLFAFQSILFLGEYFIKYPKYSSFLIDYDKTLNTAIKYKRKDEKIAITTTISFNYVYTLLYTKFDPLVFQQANWNHNNQKATVYSFGDFVMMGSIENSYPKVEMYQSSMDYLSKQKSYLCILQNAQMPLDGKFDVLYKDERWQILRCYGCSNFEFTRKITKVK